MSVLGNILIGVVTTGDELLHLQEYSKSWPQLG